MKSFFSLLYFYGSQFTNVSWSQAEQRVSTAGLGSKQSTYTPLPGETYKDCVKKMMFARYHELSEQENGGS